MTQHRLTRRNFSIALTSLLSALGLAPSVAAFRPGSLDEGGEILRTAEAIHQEVVLKANRKRVYEALTDAEQFRKISKDAETKISREPGGAFLLFGKAIAGRQLELIPGERIVQAWRANGWVPGDYSIARFELKEQGSDTKIVFDHTGFPKGQAEHLADGWKQHYWGPLAEYFAS
jgi:uncharacterized protein YndB with AHSA1/START domain